MVGDEVSTEERKKDEEEDVNDTLVVTDDAKDTGTPSITDEINVILGRTPNLSSNPYAYVVGYDQPGPINLLRRQNYKVSLKVGITAQKMVPTIAIIDTRAGINPVSSNLLSPKWSSRIKPMADSGLSAATKQSVNVEAVILLHVQLGDLPARVWLGVVTGLAVSVLLGKSFIVGFVTGIFPPERKVVPKQSKPVEIIEQAPPKRKVMKISDTAQPTGKDDNNDNEEERADEQTPVLLLRVAKQRRIPAHTQCSVLVVSRSKWNSYPKHTPASGKTKLVPG